MMENISFKKEVIRQYIHNKNEIKNDPRFAQILGDLGMTVEELADAITQGYLSINQ